MYIRCYLHIKIKYICNLHIPNTIYYINTACITVSYYQLGTIVYSTILYDRGIGGNDNGSNNRLLLK